MWVKVIILCAFSVGSLYSDDNDSNCDIADITNDEWTTDHSISMNDADVNKAIFNSSYKGNLDNLKSHKCTTADSKPCGGNYFQPSLDTNSNRFLVETTNALKNFDEDIIKDLSNPVSSVTLIYSCQMTCQISTKSSILTFFISVTDYNDFPPDFSTGSTDYKVSSPIMKGVDFSMYGDEIYASDKDFSNDDINFKIEPEDFEIIKTVTDDKPKKFKIKFKAKKVLQIKDDVKYLITATDSGKLPGPLNSTITVTLKVDPGNVVDNPIFEYPGKSNEYAFRYEKNHTLTTIDGPIKITTNRPSELEKSVSLSGELADKFSATFDTPSSSIKFGVKTNIDNPTSAFVILSLMVKTDTMVSAPIVIYFANAPEDDTPKFNQHLYTGKYDDSTNKTSLDQKIIVSSTSALSMSSFKITGDYSANFKIKLDDDKKSYSLDMVKALTPTEIKSKDYLSLTINVTVGSKSDTTGVIVYLPAHKLEFKEVLYKATYYENNTITAETIDFANDITNSIVSVQVDDTYLKYFSVKSTSKGVFFLELIGNLPDTVLQTQTEIAIVIIASDKYENQAQAVIKMTLPPQNAPKFTKPYYLVQYQKDQKAGTYIDFNPAIAFDNVDVNKVKLVINADYKDYFKMVFDSNKWRINVLKPLTDELLKENELVTTIEASEDEVTKKSQGVLVINLKVDTAEAPKFKDSYYIVQYNTTIKYMEFEPAINFTNVDVGSVNITLSDHSDNFELVLDTGKWKLLISKPLDESILENSTEIAIKMIATEKDLTGTGDSALIIKLTDAKEIAPVFQEPYYIVQYQKDQKAGTYIDFNPAIAFDNINVEKVALKLSDFSKYFELDLDATNKVWRIKVNTPLDDSVLKHKAEILTTMEATKDGVAGKGVGVLVIQIPAQDKEALEFNDLYYKVVYKQGQTGYLDFTNDIAFNNVDDISKVDIKLIGYRDNFKLVYDDKKWRIKIDKALDDKVFATSKTLVVTMEASLPDTDLYGDVVLMIDLEANVPQFGNDYYTAEYPESGSGIFNFDKALDFVNVNLTDVNLRLENYYDNFNITYNSTEKKWDIDIKTPLEDSVISKNEYLVTKLIAKIVDVGNEITATMVLKLPKKQAPVFNKTSYEAEYTIKDKLPVVTFTDFIGFKTKPINTNIIIASDDFSGDFSFKFTYSTNSWQMIVDKPLDGKYLDKTNLVVTITATDIINELQAHSTIDLKLPATDTKDAPKFSKSYYTGRYEVANGTVKSKVILDEDIMFLNKKNYTNIGITLDSGYSEIFTFSLETNSKWDLLVRKPLNPSILSSGNDIIMQMEAIESSIKGSGVSTLLLKLPKINDDQAPKFDRISYRSLCTANTTELDLKINITNRKEEDFKNIKVDILEDAYKDNFDVKFDGASSTWRVEVKSLPKIGDKNNLVLTLTATESNGTTKEVGMAGLLIEFPVLIAPKFSSYPYIGSYNVTDNSFKTLDFNVTNKDHSKLTLNFSSKDGDFSKYFSINYVEADKVWRMSLKNPIEELTAIENDEIVLTISAAEDNNPNIGETTAIIKIIDASKNRNEIEFSRVHYSASYRTVNNDPVVKLDEYIQVTSTKDVTKASVSLQSASDFEPASYFKIEKKTDHFEISALRPLSTDILRKYTNLVVTLMVELEGSKNYATLIIDLSPVETGDNIKFNSVVYMGTYEDKNNVTKITYDPIKVITVRPENVALSITNAYRDYFTLTYNASDSTVALNLVKSIPPSDIEDFSTVAVVVEAMDTLSRKIANAVINLRIISDGTPSKNGVVLFNKISNTAKYLHGSFTLDKSIGLTTDRTEDDIEASIEDSAFSKYFTAYYLNQEFTVKLMHKIPEEDIPPKPFITLTLVASIKNTNETSKASLTVQLDNDNHDHHEPLKATKYVVSISLLAVIIILLILAAVAFYYFRLRKKNEAKMTEEEYIEKREVRFERTSSQPSEKASRSSAIDERRPTGFIFNRQDVDEDESSTEDSSKDRKKSVIFDEVVEKMTIEDTADDDKSDIA